MTPVTFGDLVGAARSHLEACARVSDLMLSGTAAQDTARIVGRMALTLSRCLEDFAPYGIAEAITSTGMHSQARAAVDGREALRFAAGSLAVRDNGGGAAASHDDPRVTHLDAAATAVAASRDLLRSHFTTSPDGEMTPRSDWSWVITSAPVARALLQEAAYWSQQLTLLTARLAGAAAADAVVPVAVSQRLADGCRWLLTASAAMEVAADSNAPEADTDLLYVIPASFLPEPQMLRDGETADELAEGIAASAARVRVIVRATPGHATWPPSTTADSWRWTATGTAVICNLSEIMLRTLAGHPDPSLATQTSSSPTRSDLVRTADTASYACVRWQDVASAWIDITTGTRGLTSPSVADTSDLVVRMGRLAFGDPCWTPARSRSASARSIAGLATDGSQAAIVISAIHRAVEALACAADADLRAVDAAIGASRLYMPTRALPETYDVHYRYWNLSPARAAGLRDAYEAANASIHQMATELDGLALALGSPCRIRAAARTQARLVAEHRMHSKDHPTLDPPVVSRTVVGARPGPVEQAVRGAGGADMIELMRARAIDKAARELVAQAHDHASHGDDDHSPDIRPNEPAPRTPVQTALASFPRAASAAASRRPPREAAAGIRPRRSVPSPAFGRQQRH